MSGRRAAGNNRIRGPQSALTDFLASNSISAAQIRADYEARQQAAFDQNTPENQQESSADQGGTNEADDGDDSEHEPTATESPAQQRKRKRQEKAAVEKIKKSKAFKKTKARLAGEPGEDDDDGIAIDLYEKSRPPPGQFSHCEICEKRFTVTTYSREGPAGGLLCGKCSKETDNGKKTASGIKKVPSKRKGRRQKMSELLDGNVKMGSKPLVDLCLERIAGVSDYLTELPAISESLLNQLAMIFSKRRVMNSHTSHLFVRPDRDKIVIYDAAELKTADYAQIFAIAPKLKHLKLTNAGQMKDETIDYMIDRNLQLQTLQLEAPNLVTDEKWQQLFISSGHSLQNFKIDGMDSSFTDETVDILIDHCPNLRRLKIRACTKLTEASVQSIARLQHLEHLSLAFDCQVSGETLAQLITSIGPDLITLSLDSFEDAGNDVLDAIHQYCKKLKKIRFSHNDYATDESFAELFSSWNNPPLSYIDFNSCRDIDNQNPDGPENPVGLASGGFAALMEHSGQKLEYLKIASCRHIGHVTLQSVFDGQKQYPRLEEIDLSLIPEIDDVIVTGVFKSCPGLKKLIVFACFGVRDVNIPAGVALIGVPKPQEDVVQGAISLV